MRGAVGELELVPLAVLDVLDVGEQEAGAVGGVGDHGVAQRHPDVRAVAPPEPQLGPAALGGGAQQGPYVLGVHEVGEGVAPHHGRRAGPSSRHSASLVRSRRPCWSPPISAMAMPRGRVLEGLPEAFLAGAQGLLLALQADQGALHVCAEPGVADRNRGLRRVHLERFPPPGAGLASVAGFVDGDDAEELLGAARRSTSGRRAGPAGATRPRSGDRGPRCTTAGRRPPGAPSPRCAG